MGQYYQLANLDKKEYVNPWNAGSVGKFWEWIANNTSRLLIYLVKKSDGCGGGDEYFAEEKHNYKSQFAGRWAEDRVVLIGDYDSSKLYEELDKPEWTDITLPLVQEYNLFAEVEELMLFPKSLVEAKKLSDGKVLDFNKNLPIPKIKE